MKEAKKEDIAIVVVHERDICKGGSPFRLIIVKTSNELLIGPPFTIFRDNCYSPSHILQDQLASYSAEHKSYECKMHIDE